MFVHFSKYLDEKDESISERCAKWMTNPKQLEESDDFFKFMNANHPDYPHSTLKEAYKKVLPFKFKRIIITFESTKEFNFLDLPKIESIESLTVIFDTGVYNMILLKELIHATPNINTLMIKGYNDKVKFEHPAIDDNKITCLENVILCVSEISNELFDFIIGLGNVKSLTLAECKDISLSDKNLRRLEELDLSFVDVDPKLIQRLKTQNPNIKIVSLLYPNNNCRGDQYTIKGLHFIYPNSHGDRLKIDGVELTYKKNSELQVARLAIG